MTTMDESFATLLEETFDNTPLEGRVVKGKVIALDKDAALIDVGLKADGRIPLKEFTAFNEEIEVGSDIDVYVERLEDRNGEALLSREKARREASWYQLEEVFEKKEPITGVIFSRVKGGFTVDIQGVVAFLPGSQVDIRPIRDVTPLIGQKQPFQILKMDKKRGNIVVSRRAILEESRSEHRSELMEKLSIGDVVEGIVKNVTDYGAFVDLGGVDGLLHVTDISWKRISHPSNVLSVGQSIKVKITNFDEKTQRISLGLKQLNEDPWKGIEARYQIGQKVTGRITNIMDYGAFVELEDGLEGLVHVSEMSWIKKNVHPNKIVSTSQEVDVVILDINLEKRRISLGLKQCTPNPWEDFQQKFSAGDEIEGVIKNITHFGLFVGITDDIDGMIHTSDLSWEEENPSLDTYKEGDSIKAKILDIDPERSRISLGVKQLSSDPFSEMLEGIKVGDIVTSTVENVTEGGLEVLVHGKANGFIKKSDLAIDRADQRTDHFAQGEKIDAKVVSIDRASRRVNLSIKAREIAEEKAAMETYGSSDSGALLGDILGKALQEKEEKKNKE